MSPEPALRKFVRALLSAPEARRDGDAYAVGTNGPRASRAQVAELVSSGALDGTEHWCRANATTSSWLRRSQLDAGALAAQHRTITRSAGGVDINLDESPLSRLGAASGSVEPFLARHHVEAGERIRRLVERAQLQPRVTMTYSGSATVGNGRSSAADISDFAADARREIASIHRLLPADCAGVVIDVCGLLKGLQQVERERGWPRRSAKLVLRIGLEQLAQHYGLESVARGRAHAPQRSWLAEGARPTRFA